MRIESKEETIGVLISNRINELIKRSGISVDELSKESGVTKKTIEQLMSGDGGEVKISKLDSVLETLRISKFDFFSTEEAWKKLMSVREYERGAIYIYEHMSKKDRKKVNAFVKELHEAKDKGAVFEKYKNELIESSRAGKNPGEKTTGAAKVSAKKKSNDSSKVKKSE